VISLHIYLTFAGAAALLLIVPGPTNALLLTAAAAQSVRHAVLLILAELVAYALSITALLLFHAMLGSWRVFGGAVMKAVAIAIIVMVAARLWRARSNGVGGPAPHLVTASSVFWMTLFNPKGLIFAFAIFPPVLGAVDIAVKGVVFIALAVLAGLAWIAAGALLSAGRHGSAWIGKAAAIVLCGFAVYMSMSVVADARLLFG
jgi:threonine/homoserine/homoserine lactone efflux protein